MTQAERDQSEARRKLIDRQRREANRPRPIRVIAPSDRGDELLARLGISPDDDRAIDWKALTASA